MTPKDLKRIREQLGLTQAALAKELGVTSNSVARWEQGIYRISPMAQRLISSLAKSPKAVG
jgi:DNA-binding transcriptional regulator YiaG